MGKVVRSTEFAHGPYVLSVPHGGNGGASGTDAALATLPAPFDLEAVVRESSRLVDDAAEDARRLIADAHKRAATILDKADQDAHELERQARENGLALGRAEALALIEEELRDARVTMNQIIDGARRQRRSFIEGAEREIIRLAYTIAERVIGQEIERDPNVVASVTRAAIKRLVDRDRVVLRVNPQDLERMRAQREDMLALGDIQDIRVIGDARVDRGGVVMETDAGMVDARVAAQLQQAERVLEIEEPAPAVAK